MLKTSELYLLNFILLVLLLLTLVSPSSTIMTPLVDCNSSKWDCLIFPQTFWLWHQNMLQMQYCYIGAINVLNSHERFYILALMTCILTLVYHNWRFLSILCHRKEWVEPSVCECPERSSALSFMSQIEAIKNIIARARFSWQREYWHKQGCEIVFMTLRDSALPIHMVCVVPFSVHVMQR